MVCGEMLTRFATATLSPPGPVCRPHNAATEIAATHPARQRPTGFREEQFFLEILNPGYFINLWNFSLQRGELLGCMMTALSGRHVGAIQCDLKKCPGSVTARPWGLIFSP